MEKIEKGQIISGLIIILIIFWNRILRCRTPQMFEEMANTNIYIFISLISSVIFLVLFITEIRRLINKERESLIIKIIEKNPKIKNIIKKYIIEAPEYLYERITRNIDIGKIIENPASHFTAKFEEYYKEFVIIFYFMPQIMVSTVFFLETSFLNQRMYFFKVLWLLVFFIIAKLIIFIFKHYSIRRLTHLESFLDIKKNGNGETEVALKPPHLLPKHLKLSAIVENYNTTFMYYCIYKTILTFMEKIEEYYTKQKHKILIIVYLEYLLGWLYTFTYFYVNSPH